MKIVDTLPHHLQSPRVSLQSHLRQKQLDLAHDIRAAKKVYLDTKFWILLRDAQLGCGKGEDIGALLEIIRTGVMRGKLICPISADTYIELFRQTDPVTRRACAALIDDLSCGVAIIELGGRISLEVHQFICRNTKGTEAVYAMEELVWTKLPYVLGFVTPQSDSLPPEVDLAMQKAFLDQLWVTTIAEMFDLSGKDAGPLTEPCADISDWLNRGKIEHHHENRSFKQLFLSELWGVLDLYKPCFKDIMAYIYEKDTGQIAGSDQEAGRMVANLIYHGFRLNKLTRELPSLWLGAGFHAAVRWDLTRKFKPNDMSDFRHAVAAIPYCDLFLTERSLKHLVSDRNLRLEKLFPCKTFADASSAITALESICE